jgi:hypothetical protein
LCYILVRRKAKFAPAKIFLLTQMKKFITIKSIYFYMFEEHTRLYVVSIFVKSLKFDFIGSSEFLTFYLLTLTFNLKRFPEKIVGTCQGQKFCPK